MIKTLKENMRNGWVSFKYTKKDGSERTAIGTLKLDIIKEYNATPVGNTEYDDSVVTRYFDKNSNGWRSFRNDNFIEIC